MTTTHFSNVRPMPKAFSWSYTKLKNYETCPKRHFHYDVRKDIKEPEGEALKLGNYVHKILEERLDPAKKKPLPQNYAYLEDWAKRVEAGPGIIVPEQQLAITKNFEPCAWFDSENPPDKKAWYRAKIDIMKVNGPVAILIDWKTGKIVEDTPQLLLSAACVFYHHPEIQVVRSMFAWLAEGAETTEDLHRSELPAMWNNLWSRIETLKQAHETSDYPPQPSYLCRKYCGVVSCPHHGIGP